MVKAFTKGIATFFVACALLLALPALSFADESTSGGGKSLSDFTDVDWNTVTLSLAQDEYVFDEKGRYEGIDVGDLRNSSGDLRLYVAVEDKKELLFRYTYDYDYCFYSDTEGHEVEDGVTETGTYYVKVTLKDYSSGYECYDRYVPVTITIKNVDPYDLANYSPEDPIYSLYVGDTVLDVTSQAFEEIETDFTYYGFNGMVILPEDAYKVDPVWYKAEETDGSDGYSYTKIEGVPTKYGYYGIRIYGTGSYKGDLYIKVKIDDVKHSSNFYISSENEVALSNYKTVKDLQDKLQVSFYGRSDEKFAKNVLTLNADYEILKWGLDINNCEAGDDDDEAYSEVSLSDDLQGGVYAVKLKPCGDYYGEGVWLRIVVRDLDSLDSYDFDVDCGDRSNLIIGLDDLDISGLKVNASCSLGDEEVALTQGVDFELGSKWYVYSFDSDGNYSPKAIEGLPSERDFYVIQVIGKGSFAGQTAYAGAYVYDCTKLDSYSLSYGRYLVSGDSLLPEKMELNLKGDFGDSTDDPEEPEPFVKTLVYGTDYIVRWGHYDSSGSKLLNEGEYPEVTEDTSNVWYLKVIGIGDFEGQELSPEYVTIHTAECTHPNIRSYDEEPECTFDGVSGRLYCPDCGYEAEGEVIPALGHNYEVVAGTAKAATCAEDGKEADEECSNCGDYIEGETIPALGHNYAKDESSAKDATCTDDGKEADEKCSRCGDVKRGAAIKANGAHSYEVDSSDATPAKTATCTEDGYEPAKVCSNCGAKVEGRVIEATGKHTPVVSKAAVAATYKAAGLTEEIKCSVCGTVLQAQSTVAKLSAKAQSVKVSTATKTVKKAKVKKKAQTVSGAIKVSGAQGKVSFAKASGSGKLKVNASNGKITVKKKTKKGTYSIKVRVNVAASADGQFNAFSKTVTVKVKVK